MKELETIYVDIEERFNTEEYLNFVLDELEEEREFEALLNEHTSTAVPPDPDVNRGTLAWLRDRIIESWSYWKEGT